MIKGDTSEGRENQTSVDVLKVMECLEINVKAKEASEESVKVKYRWKEQKKKF